MTAWPVFWKACHLTQSSSEGTRAIKKMPDAEQRAELVEWLKGKWDFRANDFERVWVATGNQLTQDITPGFLLQVCAP